MASTVVQLDGDLSFFEKMEMRAMLKDLYLFFPDIREIGCRASCVDGMVTASLRIRLREDFVITKKETRSSPMAVTSALIRAICRDLVAQNKEQEALLEEAPDIFIPQTALSPGPGELEVI